MFKTRDEVQSFINKLETFIANINYLKMLQSQGLSEAATAMATVLNKNREELETFICETTGVIEKALVNPTTSPDCPECGGEMLLRTNRQDGNKFWGCKKYPNCRGTRDSSGLSREERQAKQNKYDQESGFSFNKKRSPANEVGPSNE